MVVSKRKITNENERYAGFDTVIEVDDVKAKSFGAAQTSVGAPTYTTRKEVESVSVPKTDEEVMPKIRRKEQPVVQAKTKQALNFKTKVLLTAYLALAVVLAAVVIATGVAVSNASRKVEEREAQFVALTLDVNDKEGTLDIVSDPAHITGEAIEMGFVKVDNTTAITLLEYSEPAPYAASTNWFNNLCEFFSRIFS